jgi:hypothetical protein
MNLLNSQLFATGRSFSIFTFDGESDPCFFC